MNSYCWWKKSCTSWKVVSSLSHSLKGFIHPRCGCRISAQELHRFRQPQRFTNSYTHSAQDRCGHCRIQHRGRPNRHAKHHEDRAARGGEKLGCGEGIYVSRGRIRPTLLSCSSHLHGVTTVQALMRCDGGCPISTCRSDGLLQMSIGVKFERQEGW